MRGYQYRKIVQKYTEEEEWHTVLKYAIGLRLGPVEIAVRGEILKHRPALFTLMFFAAVTVSYADAVVGDFDLDSGLNPVASQGEVTFSLNPDGTIAATLATYFNGIVGFGFNSLTPDLPESGFLPTAPANPYGWSSDAFGDQTSGFLCSGCGMSESWTIGTTGEFSSVYDVLDGGSASSVDFFLFDSSGGQYGADATSATPEPGSLTLMATGLLGAFAAFRRKRSA
jgi:hypothetical protein